MKRFTSRSCVLIQSRLVINEHIHLIATSGSVFGIFQAGFQVEMSHHKISLCAMPLSVLI